jgi:hypothetical protein
MTSYKTLGNWSHFVKPIYRIKNLPKVEKVTKRGIQLLYWVAQTAVLNNAF